MTAVRSAHAHNGSSAGSKENGQNTPSPVNTDPNTNVFPPADIGADKSGSSVGELTQTWIHFTKTFVLIFPIYVLGYFEFSFSWLLIGLVIFFWWRRNTGGKNTRLYRALAFFEQEERTVKRSLTTSHLPSWVRPRCIYKGSTKKKCTKCYLYPPIQLSTLDYYYYMAILLPHLISLYQMYLNMFFFYNPNKPSAQHT